MPKSVRCLHGSLCADRHAHWPYRDGERL